jgi:CBS domain-containing protein
MTRRDDHFDAMLRHLGATYYQTLLGEATPSDVAAAVDSVERESAHRPGGTAGHGRQPAHRGQRSQTVKTGRWRVRDVMTPDVVSVGKQASGTTLARLLSEHHISAVPVLTGAGKLAGVVSEADLLKAQRHPGARARDGLLRRRPRATRGHPAYTAGHLMTSPAITIHPDAPLAVAARRMTDHHLTLLPVVDESAVLIGVISRRDLLSVYLRPDADIVAEVSGVLADVLFLDPAAVTVSAHDGLVTLTGEIDQPEFSTLAIRLASGVDGVLAVADKLATAPASAQAHPGG